MVGVTIATGMFTGLVRFARLAGEWQNYLRPVPMRPRHTNGARKQPAKRSCRESTAT